MSDLREYNSEQEAFWAGQFGNEYIGRNDGSQLLASNLNFFSRALRRAGRIQSCLEFGANIGLNLKALRLLYPEMHQRAIEINQEAAGVLAATIGDDNVYCGAISDYPVGVRADLVLVKGVLIHINPDALMTTYEKLVSASCNLVLVAEYYNPSPVQIPYRGFENRLYKRDFAGEMLQAFPELELEDYGFVYRGDPAFPQDDITWFLLRKKANPC